MTDEEIIAYIRVLLGSISTDTISDDVIQVFLTKEETAQDVATYSDRQPVVIFNTMIDCVRWLIAQEVSSGDASITERMEKIGDETIQIKSGSSVTTWQDFLDWLYENPDYVDSSLTSQSKVLIGGVRKDRFNSVKRNVNSKSFYSERGIYPSRGQFTR